MQPCYRKAPGPVGDVTKQKGRTIPVVGVEGERFVEDAPARPRVSMLAETKRPRRSEARTPAPMSIAAMVEVEPIMV
jgi:hypothetical protein